MRSVNLLPRDEQGAKLTGKRTPLLVGVGGIAAVTAAAFILGHSASGALGGKRAELASMEASIARIPPSQQPAAPSGEVVQERTDRTTALSAALSTRIAFDQLLRQIALVLPADAWLTGLKATAPTTLAPAGGAAVPGSSGSSSGSTTPPPSSSPQSPLTQEVTIEGATYSQASVARVLARLAVVPTLADVQLTSSAIVDPSQSSDQSQAPKQTVKTKKGKQVVTFSVSATLRTRSTQ
jgi:Tfp pilus assembly protein PilN